ncbi:MAG: DUF1292 domain-containing protein [Clostridium sp.]|jgi:hypothetical protein|nr:DUF1292 domain-containing protein [Clostridium sp.]
MGSNEILENEGAEEEMTVELELNDGQKVTCSIVTIFSVGDQDYIALMPLDENQENHDGGVWIYGYEEDPNDETAEPKLRFISDEEEYEAAADAYDEFLDDAEFDEIMEESEDM